MSAEEDFRLAVDSGGALCANCKVKILPTCSYPPLPLNILRSNQIPSNVEIPQILYTLREEEKELQRYDEEIERLLLTVKRLKDDREQLQRKVDMRRSYLAPIRRLPPEIIANVFDLVITVSHSLSIKENKERRYDHQKRKFPAPEYITAIALSLSHVSFRWRNLAVSHRSIWSTISVGLFGMMRDVLSPLLQLYLNNAAGHPLRMEIKEEAPSYMERPRLESAEKVLSHFGPGGVRLIQTLAGHFPSCEVLNLDSLQPDVLLYTMDTAISFPLLHTLICNKNDPIFPENEIDGTPSNFLFWNAVRDAPLLRNVHLNETGQSHHQEYIPWRQLASLSVDHIEGYTNLQFVISRTRQLEVLRIGQRLRLASRFAIPRHQEENQPIYYPRLRKVDLFNLLPYAADYVLASIDAPFIKDFRISIEEALRLNGRPEEPRCWDSSVFYSMITRTTCSLIRLDLSVFPFGIWGESFALFVKALQVLTLLEHLEVQTGKSGPEESTRGGGRTRSFLCSIFSSLTVSSSSSQVLLPRLKDIRVQEPLSASGQRIMSVLDMVEQRSPTGLATIDRTDVTPFTNVLIGIDKSSGYWHKNYDRQPVEQRMAALGRNGTKCGIRAYFRM
ncbi:hypothetical protein VNI00_004643 [Paramarasmius palmivorus]|uniref:F-box domain-containing protein n=1 Tax=Paramarasmius palmivorus TaxID=297713 RepID=A0AAW0DI96_9AGAR